MGIPLQIDRATREKRFVYLAKILVEVDLNNPLPDWLTIELPDYGFDVEVHYENLPTKCSGCLRFGHAVSECRINKEKTQVAEKKSSRPLIKQVYKKVMKDLNKKPISENLEKASELNTVPASEEIEKCSKISTSTLVTYMNQDGSNTKSDPVKGLLQGEGKSETSEAVRVIDCTTTTCLNVTVEELPNQNLSTGLERKINNPANKQKEAIEIDSSMEIPVATTTTELVVDLSQFEMIASQERRQRILMEAQN